MLKLKLTLNSDHFERLHECTTRKRASRITVDRAALVALLADYSALLNLCKGQWEEPKS